MGHFKSKITVGVGYNVIEEGQYTVSLKKNVALSKVGVKVKEKYYLKKYRPDGMLVNVNVCMFVFLVLQHIVVVFSQPSSAGFSFSCSRFLDHTQRRATVGRTPLDE
jgi:hypothetical protein